MKILANLLVALFLIGAFWLRVDDLANTPPGMSNDESIYLIDTFNVSRGGSFTFFEHGRPEPGFQLILSITTHFFGGDPFVVRLTPIFLSLLTIAIVYWSTMQLLYDRPLYHRQLSALLASTALATSLGFITLSRAIERGVPQVLFMALFIGAFALFMRTRRWRDVVLAGSALAGTIYFYTAGLIMPAVLAPIGLILLIFHLSTWKKWLGHFISISIIVGLLTLPCALTLLINSGLILDRAGDVVGTGFSLDQSLSLTWSHLLIQGDPNSQYNTASMPMLLPPIQPFFILGLFMLIICIKHPTSIAIFTFLIFGALPPLLTNEPIHGIRAIGMFGAFPFIVGMGCAGVLWAIDKISSAPIKITIIVGSILLIGASIFYANSIYRAYWNNPPVTSVYVDQLTVGEWYFRQDRRDVARWLMAQNRPILLPVEELNQPTMRAWTLNHIPNLKTTYDEFVLPINTLLFLPWQIETDAIRDKTRLYALVQSDTMTLLPPFSPQTHQRLLAIGIDGEPLIRENADYLHVMGYIADIPNDFIASYVAPNHLSQTPLAEFEGDKVALIQWYGTDTIQGTNGEELSYFLQWRGQQLDQRYHTVLQLHTQSFDNKASAADVSLAYLYPQTIWDENIPAYIEYTLFISENLPYGAYRLVAGIYDFKARIHLPAFSHIAPSLDTLATIGWIKVPHPPMQIDGEMQPIEAILGDTIRLQGVRFDADEDILTVQLVWNALLHRPSIDTTLFVHVYTDEQRLGQIDTRPLDGQYPTLIWDLGETVVTTHHIPIDGMLTRNSYLLVGMYTFPTLERLSVTINDVTQPDNVIRILLND